jgi:protein-tyrosine phosphatase
MPDEVEEFNLEREQEYCQCAGISFHSLPVADRSVPISAKDAQKLIGQLASELNEGENVMVHCRQGIGRSGLIAIAVLIQSGQKVDAAITFVSVARGRPVPETEHQLEWVRSISTLHR